MSQPIRNHLTLVRKGFEQHARKEKLLARATVLLPESPQLAEKWVAARLYVGARRPAVDIGIQRIDTSRTARALPMGSVAELIEVPNFLRRFIK